MPIPGQIGPREREILTAIVETYISTGEPVGSRTLSRQNKDGLSPATIRNVMADLVDAGFLDQPHTSAGRVPTAEAYRYYVDQISGKTEVSPADQTLIAGTLQGTVDVQEFLQRTSHVLSLVSSGVGVAIANSGEKNALDHVYFSRQGEKKDRFMDCYLSADTVIYAVYPQHRHQSPKVRAYVDFMTERFGPRPSWDAEAEKAKQA